MTDLSRIQITALLSALTEKMISRDYDPRSYWSKEVTFDYGIPNPVRVDYIVCPNELYDWLSQNNKLPFGVGVYAPAEDNSKLTCVKKARRKDRQRPVYEMLLMMLRSARRDVIKSKVEDCHD